ncbi:MAG: anaerobic carbon-monoxide dehydrogenase catalytic subunit [Candidatus Scalindua sp. AMX11]|nr:MAG: anaerobic carbon-monoxide dehydrogenase catalytic subunit [Candidatus Scalindua sp.]NOG85948.1 anaerobic carbon-monoxide dehydrogenase catalytic subunit [Planctomycetota bacterium]RZV91419.1 MAG: anaerobic carbon-monoxide dehydrogenase catalytic subunit [Candidatus Scalindua sp. SCAELEC01]TDE65977.1 MAG: anaerobic carbon-monoxide dehydrogenase catalytic subunit [Candidatus Scalindua sp. AMX11]GJQ59286.1 MAG: carbon-monoxide dehydrogenase catalytic subunit [Candidatus Scalindua sp.]
MARNYEGADRESLELLKKMEEGGIESSYDRYDAQQPQCGFGKIGLCCRHCQMGPCNVDPFGRGPKKGVCGADANTIAARHFVRYVAAGTAAHSDHGRSVAHLLIATARGEAKGYKITDIKKLHEVAALFEVSTEGRKVEEIAEEVGEMALAEFGKAYGTQAFAKKAPINRQKVWEKLDVTPRAIDREVTESMHRTGMGTDQDYKNLILHACRTSLADGWGGAMIATELQDILFGTPKPKRGTANLGVIREDEVNILVHGHEPQMSEMVAVASQDPEMLKAAEAVGAKGISLAGICCTANEMLMRHGIPLAGHMKMQEMALATGAIEAITVDIQCVMQGDEEVASHFHTKMITTSPKAKIAGTQHIEINDENAYEKAKEIVKIAIDNYPNRDRSRVYIPKGKKSDVVVGFTHETIKYMLGGTYRASYRPLNDNIMNGRIRGVVGVVGCTSSILWPDQMPYMDLVNELIANNILVVQTGCAAAECAREGMMVPEHMKNAGEGLREVCEAVGMPPVLHAGSCVDNSRILISCSEMVKEGGLGNDISELPVAGVCLDWMHEKALAIGHYFVTSGVYTLFGTKSPASGAPDVDKFLSEELEELVGGKWSFEPDLKVMAKLIIDHIEKKRDALGINVKKERKLYDMEDRRQLAVDGSDVHAGCEPGLAHEHRKKD